MTGAAVELQRPRPPLRRTRGAERSGASSSARAFVCRVRSQQAPARRRCYGCSRHCCAPAPARCAYSAARSRRRTGRCRARRLRRARTAICARADGSGFHARLHGCSDERVSELLELTALAPRADEPLRTLSARGMVQRAAVRVIETANLKIFIIHCRFAYILSIIQTLFESTTSQTGVLYH